MRKTPQNPTPPPTPGPRLLWKPGTLLAPVPVVLVTCGDIAGERNVLTVAWTGTICSDPPMCSISVRPERHSHSLLTRSPQFVINLVTRPLLHAADWCGVKSGRDHDKFAEMSLDPLPAARVRAPLIAQSPVSLECEIRQTLPMGSHDLFLAEIVAVQVDGALLNPHTGVFRFRDADPICFAHGRYYGLGEPLGAFGFSVARRKRARNRRTTGASQNARRERNGGDCESVSL